MPLDCNWLPRKKIRLNTFWTDLVYCVLQVNHFPGTGYITNKVSLATSSLKYVPKAFRLPSDKSKLLEYTKNNPDKLWVQKSNNHRGIKIQKLEDMDLSSDGTFIQEYIQKPLLINGRKFDIGIYAILTSINPIRVYIYDGDVLLRFCSQSYHPFNANDVNKYVIGDDYTPVWEVSCTLQHLKTKMLFWS